jgi:hypothetical protein
VERLQERLASRIGIDARDQRAVHLDEVRLQLDHRLEARVAGPGVVHGEAEAELPVLVADLPEDVEVRDRLLLGDLEHHVRRPELALLQGADQRLGAKARIVNGGGAHVQEQLGLGRKADRAVDPALAAQAVELEDQRVLLRRGEEGVRRVELGPGGSPGQGLVAEHGLGRDVDDRLVDRGHLLRHHHAEKALAPLPRLAPGGELGVAAGLLERPPDLGLGAEVGVAQGGGEADAQDRNPSEVRVHDSLSAPLDGALERADQARDLGAIELPVPLVAEQHDHDLVPARLSAQDQLVAVEHLVGGVADQSAERVRGARVGVVTVGALDLRQRGGVEQHHSQGSLAVEALHDGRNGLAEARQDRRPGVRRLALDRFG